MHADGIRGTLWPFYFIFYFSLTLYIIFDLAIQILTEIVSVSAYRFTFLSIYKADYRTSR